MPNAVSVRTFLGERPFWSRRPAAQRYSWPFSEAVQCQEVIHVENLDERLVSGFERRGWGDLPREAVVIPISLGGNTVPSAVLVIGINPRMPYDATYRGDMDIFRMSLGSALRATLGREAEVKRAEPLDS